MTSKGTAETVSLGVAADGRKVTKRIIKFRGYIVSQTQTPDQKTGTY
jgi:hypothetical protein